MFADIYYLVCFKAMHWRFTNPLYENKKGLVCIANNIGDLLAYLYFWNK